ncbi:MAG: hypothetical protein BWX62_01087 [Bacteroidetes bacterium ADurb.Bin037]|nr:MAG: hypothetical protein BWX62_01087 [Bacteroidetes bacterium ADurb.Bin037]HPW79163.1 hypothetical protein [Bacteroidales bacterium]
MKNLIIASVLLALPLCMTAQTNFDYLKRSGKKGEYVTVINVTSSAIEYENSYGVKKSIPVNEVDFLEYEGKVVYYQYNKNIHDVYDEQLKRISRRDPEKLLEKGARVYVPLMYGESRWNIMGCINTRKMLVEDHDDFWKLVETEYEAEIILFYVIKYDDDEMRHYYVIETRDGETIYKSDDEELEGGWRANWDVSREHVEDLLDDMINDID